MISKKLYLAKWLENCKRRNWTFLCCLSLMLLAMPVPLLVALTGIRNSMEQQLLLGNDHIQQYRGEMFRTVSDIVRANGLFVFLAALFAVLFAIQGFSYLYSRKKLDLYKSVPVSDPKRYLMITGNSLLWFAVSYFISWLLSILIAAGFGVMNGDLLQMAVLSFIVQLLGFLAVYCLALVAVMLTGGALTALLGCGVLFFYEPLLRMFYGGMKSFFYSSYCSAEQEKLSEAFYLTPFSQMLHVNSYLFDQIVYHNFYREGSQGGTVLLQGMFWKEMAVLLLGGAVCGIAAYLLFRRRKTESCGMAVAFEGLKPLLRFGLLIPFAVGIGTLVGRYAGGEDSLLFAGTLVSLLAGHVILQLILERDLRAALQKKVQLTACAVLAVLILSVFRFDLTGYDSFVPKAADVAAVSVSIENDYSGLGDANYNVADRLLEEMDSSDPATIEAVLAMAADKKGGLKPAEVDEDGFRTYYSWDAEDDVNTWVVRYTLKNGRNVWRRFYVPGRVYEEEINAICHDASYRMIRCEILQEESSRQLNRSKILYNNGVQEYLYTADKEAFLAAYREDLEQYDYSMLKDSLPVGILKFQQQEDDRPDLWLDRWTYPVYESFANTIALLEENQIHVDFLQDLTPEDVESIWVECSIYEWEELRKSRNAEQKEKVSDDAVQTEETDRTTESLQLVIDDKEEIARLLTACYPLDMVRGSREAMDFDLCNRQDMLWDNIAVQISFSAEGRQKRLDLYGLELRTDLLPDFLIERLEKQWKK